MFSKLRSPERLRNESGNAYIEFLLCLPFVLTVLIAIIDIGRALVFYQTISRLSFEGLRYFAAQPGATFQTCTITSTAQVCTPLGFPDPVHARVRDRLELLFERTVIPFDTATITTELFGPGNPIVIPPSFAMSPADAADATSRVARVTIRAPFETFFPTFGIIPQLSARSAGPYLFN